MQPTIQIHRIGNALVIFAVASIACGALYFGMACGGHVWHKQLFRYLAPAIAISAVLTPSNLLSSTSWKVAFLLILAIGYALIEAISSTIYFSGGNWHEYGRNFLIALEIGPC